MQSAQFAMLLALLGAFIPCATATATSPTVSALSTSGDMYAFWCSKNLDTPMCKHHDLMSRLSKTPVSNEAERKKIGAEIKTITTAARTQLGITTAAQNPFSKDCAACRFEHGQPLQT